MKVKICLYNNYNYSETLLPDSLPELIVRLTEILENAPEEFRESVFFESETDYESCSVNTCIYYEREENQEEKEKRESEEEAYLKKKELMERKTYEALKKKFEQC